MFVRPCNKCQLYFDHISKWLKPVKLLQINLLLHCDAAQLKEKILFEINYQARSRATMIVTNNNNNSVHLGIWVHAHIVVARTRAVVTFVLSDTRKQRFFLFFFFNFFKFVGLYQLVYACTSYHSCCAMFRINYCSWQYNAFLMIVIMCDDIVHVIRPRIPGWKKREKRKQKRVKISRCKHTINNIERILLLFHFFPSDLVLLAQETVRTACQRISQSDRKIVRSLSWSWKSFDISHVQLPNEKLIDDRTSITIVHILHYTTDWFIDYYYFFLIVLFYILTLYRLF
jgi:hypothetical protein